MTHLAPRSFSKKNVLVVGGTGMIGSPLVELLIDEGAKVRIVSLDDPSRAHPQSTFLRLDLMEPENCLKACQNMDYVFNLFGVKGSPDMNKKYPATFFETTILITLNLMIAARKARVGGYLYTSSVGVYPPAEVFHEDDVWKGFPSENDKFPGWAKRMGEVQVEANKIEFGWEDITIIRPPNVYGPRDNFDSQNAMVIPSLIKRAIEASKTGQPLTVWGDGSPERDFIHARDVAQGMIVAAEYGPGGIYNVGNGTTYTIRQLVETVVKHMPSKVEIVWDTSKPSGDRKRLMDISRIQAIGFSPKISLDEGVKETIQWYLENRATAKDRYDVFNKK
ncbi:MAG: NAD-dependent epimerase/dehydratase family protein [bacterium]|nr:NAD-dependent epimerase/dehydratase family protein [bacterium]